ncbi:hypothetical protein ES702_02031 [subsurface metagenome]
MIKQLQMRRRMRLEAGLDPEKCCWCGRKIGGEDSLWHVVARIPCLRGPAGTEVEFELFTRERIIAYLRDAPLWNLLFRVCSGRCAHELAVALDQNDKALRETWIEDLE